MKTMLTILAGVIAVSGLVLAGAETANLATQFGICSLGVCLFAGGMFWISKIHREEL